MLITCSNCDREIEFDRDKIPWIERIKGGYKIKEKWIKCECGTRYCVEVKVKQGEKRFKGVYLTSLFCLWGIVRVEGEN